MEILNFQSRIVMQILRVPIAGYYYNSLYYMQIINIINYNIIFKSIICIKYGNFVFRFYKTNELIFNQCFSQSEH